jgi:hypothetical protein
MYTSSQKEKIANIVNVRLVGGKSHTHPHD